MAPSLPFRERMKPKMKKTALIAGVACILLGGLWLLQGLGLVQIQPILCVADCEPVQGSSSKWAIVGFLTVVIGALAVFYALRRRPPPRR